MTDTSAHGTPRGFTLIELLVVIAIIALLLSILAPLLSGVFDYGRLVMCGTRLEQLNVAHTAYAAENQGFLCRGRDYLTIEYPQANSLSGIPGWPNIGTIPDQSLLVIEGYIDRNDRLFLCPADTGQRVPPASQAIMPASFSYTRNGGIQNVGDWGFTDPRQVANPEQTLMLFEESEFSPFNDSYVIPNNWDLLTERHGGKGEILFFDGHVGVIDGATFNEQTPLWRDLNYFRP